MNCEGKVALVTGAAGSGMGRSIALTLAREGARVVVNYRTSADSAGAIVEQIASGGGEAIAIQADILQAADCRRLVKATSDTYGRVDICVIGPGGGWHPEPIDQLDPSATMEDTERELAPLFNLLPVVLPGMYETGWGRIIGIAMHPAQVSPAYAYNVGKAARLQALLLAHDQAWHKGVTINVLAPGPVSIIDTLENAMEHCNHGDAWHGRRNVSPQDIAEGVAFLCSEAGRFVSGCVLPYRFYG